MAFEALRVIRPLVKVGSRVAPRLTGNLAFRAFCTPPRAGGVTGAQRKLVERAEARLAERKAGGSGSRAETIQAYRFATDAPMRRGTVALIHGWTGRAAFMSAFVEPLNAEGFDVVALDLPGHGRSSGRTLHVPLGIAALQAVHGEFGPWHGSSRIPSEARSPTCWSRAASRAFRHRGRAVGADRHAEFDAGHLRLVRRGDRPLGNGSALARRQCAPAGGRELSEFEGDAMLRTAGTPTLILHATDDKEVGFANAERLSAAGPHVSLQPLKGLGHRRILYAPQTVEAAAPSWRRTDARR